MMLSRANLRAMVGITLSLGLTAQALGDSLPRGYMQVAQEYAVSATTLYQHAMLTALPLRSGQKRPWPWALGVAGKVEYYQTRQAAYLALQRYILAGHSVAVGLMQIDWQRHQTTLRDPWEALEPYSNLRLGARLLRDGLLTAAPVATKPPFAIHRDRLRRYQKPLRRIAAQHRLDPLLVQAVISAESAFNPQARSPAGAQGLMQLMPATARRFAVADPYDPIANMQGGSRYLRLLLDQFDDLHLALAAYNAGENTVIRYGYRIPPYRETQQYVKRVLAFYHYFKQQAAA